MGAQTERVAHEFINYLSFGKQKRSWDGTGMTGLPLMSQRQNLEGQVVYSGEFVPLLQIHLDFSLLILLSFDRAEIGLYSLVVEIALTRAYGYGQVVEFS